MRNENLFPISALQKFNESLNFCATNALHYRGIGSGIVRVLAEYPAIRLSNDASAQEFTVSIPRTIQKNTNTIQKNESTTQKEENTTQKSSAEDKSTTQKKEGTIQKSDLEDENTIQKGDLTIQKEMSASQEKVLTYLASHSHSTIEEMVEAIDGLSLGGIKFIIAKLQQQGRLKRIGGRKQGYWQVIPN